MGKSGLTRVEHGADPGIRGAALDFDRIPGLQVIGY